MAGPLNFATARGIIAEIRGHARLGQAEPVQFGFFIVQTASGQSSHMLLHNCHVPAGTSSAMGPEVRFVSKTDARACAETGLCNLF